jgi:hypothetical protein
MVDQKPFEVLVQEAHEEKKRTDLKYGNKEQGGTNKARLIAIIEENIGTFLSEQRKGNTGEKYYIRALAHMISLSSHIYNPKPDSQYLD